MDTFAEVHVENIDNNLNKFDLIQKQLDELSKVIEKREEEKEKTMEERILEAKDQTMKEMVQEELNENQ